MEERVIFRCEDSVDGIFTAVYDAWASRLGHHRVGLELVQEQEQTLFCRYQEAATDPVKAAKVADTIRRRMGAEDYERIYHCALAADLKKADAIYRTVALGLSGSGFRNVTRNLQQPFIQTVCSLSLKVAHEAHRYTGFLRFVELKNGILYAKVESPHQILPLLGEHFADRFPQENFVIYRQGTNRCVVHGAGKPWFLAEGAKLDMLNQAAEAEGQDDMSGCGTRFSPAFP